jgi:hypothetical protein
MRLILVAVLAATTAHAEPDPGRDEAERGFAALRAHDLDRAEALTRSALEHATTQAVIGAAWFNLGAIAEARGDRAAAIEAYTSSMKARPHRTTRARLEVLDPELARTLDPFAPTPMAGPIASLDQVCTVLVSSECECDDVETIAAGKRGLAAPFAAFGVMHLPCDRGSLMVAVKLAAGWYVANVSPEDTNLAHCGDPEYKIGDVTMHGHIATIEYRGSTSCSHRASEWEWREHGVIAIGVGASGKPSVTPAIALDRAQLTWSRDGSFDVEGEVGHTAATMETGVDDSENRRGKHSLVFP